MFLDEFNERVVLVTGAAQGIGREIARVFGGMGATVALNDLNSAVLSQTEQDFSAMGIRSHSFQGDVASEEDCDRIFSDVEERLGPASVLVNNAGILHLGETHRHALETWNNVLSVNLTGPFLCSKRAISGMISQGGGAIVNIASIAAFDYTLPHGAYDASKAGLVALTRTLGYELAPHNIRVNAIAPGGIPSPMHDQLSQPMREALERSLRLPRWGTGEDIARVAAFLASGYGSFVVGQTLSVAGGTDIGTVISTARAES